MANNLFTEEDFKKTRKPSKNWKKIAGSALAVAVLGGAGIAGYHQLNNSGTEAAPDTIAIVSDTVKPIDSIDSIETIPVEDGNAIVEDKAASKVKEQPVEQTVEQTVDNDSGNASSTSTTIQGTVEELALQVIRGDYGNNPVRRKKLGDRYQEIQDRVNQMYREGKVR